MSGKPSELVPSLIETPPLDFRNDVARVELELRGRRARAYQFPDGCRDARRAVVCIAGMGADGRSFARQRPLARDWLLLLLSTPYETPPAVSPIEFCADVVEEYLDSERLEAPVLLGSSFGGAVAAAIALRRERRLGGLVLANAVLARRQIPLAFPFFIDLLEAPAPLARLIAPLAVQVMGGFALDRDARDEIVREARHFEGRELKRRLESLFQLDLFPHVAALTLPTLVVHGRRDLLVPWWRGRDTARAISGAKFHLVEGAGHLPYLSHADEFNAVVARFLAGRAQPR